MCLKRLKLPASNETGIDFRKKEHELPIYGKIG
jgi:hypothetical protein